MPIENRPKVVKQRKKTGYIEVYFMIGKITEMHCWLTDRANLYTMLHKLEKKNSKNNGKKSFKINIQSILSLLTTREDFADHITIGNALNANT